MNLTCSPHHNHHHKGCSHCALPVRQPGCVGSERGATRSPSGAHRAALSCGNVETASLAVRHSEK